MEKQTGISKAFVKRHIQLGVERVAGLFETISKGNSGIHAELQRNLKDFHRQLLAVVDGIEGEKIIYEEDVQSICSEVQVGVKSIRHGWKRTNLSHAQKPFSVMVNSYMNEVCATVRQTHAFEHRPDDADVDSGTVKPALSVGDDLYGFFGEFSQDHLEDIESYCMEMVTAFETQWARDVVVVLKKERCINQSGKDEEIMSKEFFDMVIRFFTLVHLETSNLRLFMRHSHEVQGGCSFDALKAYWIKLLQSISKGKIFAQLPENPETLRLAGLLHASLVERLIPAVQALGVEVFSKLHLTPDLRISDPLPIVMPRKHQYRVEADMGGQPVPPVFSPAEHAMKKRYQKNGFSHEDTAEAMNDIFHGGLKIRDARSFECRMIKSAGSVPSRSPSLNETLSETHAGILKSFAQWLSFRLGSRLLQSFYEGASGNVGSMESLPVFLNKDEFEALSRILVLLNRTVDRYFMRLHGMHGNSRRFERYFVEQTADFEGGLEAELRSSLQGDDDFTSYFDGDDLLNVRDLGLDYRALVGQIHAGTFPQGPEERVVEDQMVACLLLKERSRDGFDGPFYPQEMILLRRYLAEVTFEDEQTVESVIQKLSADGNLELWSRSINNSLHGGRNIRSERDLVLVVEHLLEDKLAEKLRNDQERERKEVESRLSYLGKDIQEVLSWIDEIRFDQRKRKGVLYNMVDLYVNILRTVDVESGRMSCPVDVVEFQILPFLQKVKKNYEDLQMRRRSDDEEDGDGQRIPKPLFSLSPEDLADLMQNGLNKKVEFHPSTPVVDRFAFALRTIDQKISSCMVKVNQIAAELLIFESRKCTLTSKIEERDRLVKSADELTRNLDTTRLKIKTLLLDEDPDEAKLEPLVESAQVLNGQLAGVQELIGRLASEIGQLRFSLEPRGQYESEQEVLKARLEDLVTRRSLFLAQVDQLITSINHD